MPAKSNSLVILVIGLTLGFGFAYWVYPAIVDQVNGTNTKNEELTRRIQQLEAQMATLRAENQKLKQEILAAPSKENVQRLQDQVSQLRSQVSQLQYENEQLRRRSNSETSTELIQLRQENQALRAEIERLRSGVIPTPLASDPPYMGPISGNADCSSLLPQARPIGLPLRRIVTRSEFINLSMGPVSGDMYLKALCVAWYSATPQMNPIVVKCSPGNSGWQCPTPRRGSEVWFGHPYNFIQIFGVDNQGSIRTFTQTYPCENSGLEFQSDGWESQRSGWQWYCWNNGAFVGLRRVEK